MTAVYPAAARPPRRPHPQTPQLQICDLLRINQCLWVYCDRFFQRTAHIFNFKKIPECTTPHYASYDYLLNTNLLHQICAYVCPKHLRHSTLASGLSASLLSIIKLINLACLLVLTCVHSRSMIRMHVRTWSASPKRTDRRWTKYSNLGQLYPPRPPEFQSCFLLPRVERGGQKKSPPTAWHVTHTLFNFDTWGQGCQSNHSSRFRYFAHLRYVTELTTKLGIGSLGKTLHPYSIHFICTHLLKKRHPLVVPPEKKINMYCMTTQTGSIRTVARWCSRWWEIEGTRSKSPQSSLSNHCHFMSVPVVVGHHRVWWVPVVWIHCRHIIYLIHDMQI